MSLGKRMVWGICIVLVLVIVASFICGVGKISSKKSTISFFALVEQGRINELTLTIYCAGLSFLPRLPLSVNDLVNHPYTSKLVIDGSILAEHIEVFCQMSRTELIPIKDGGYRDIRTYYSIKTKEGQKIFSVASWGRDGSMFVNEHEFYNDDIFFEIVNIFWQELFPQD